MCNWKDDDSKEIESLGFIGLTKDEIQEFEEQFALDEDFRRFIKEEMNKENSIIGRKNEGFIECEIETENSYRISRDEESYAEY